MKVVLAPRYRLWMLALVPTTLGVGTAALWARSLNWPRSVDGEGVTLRYRRKIPWESIRKVCVYRDYLDGHVSRIDIHHQESVSKIPTRPLRDGENVARIILASFKLARRAHRLGQGVSVGAVANISPHLVSEHLRIDQSEPVALRTDLIALRSERLPMNSSHLRV
jgi:hypothetical protein